jgi:DNA-binding MarR family transcriptional regulator
VNLRKVKTQTVKTKTAKSSTVSEPELRLFLAHMDTLAGRLTPKRRPQDRGEPECSPQELRTLTAISSRGPLSMSAIANLLEVRLSTASHTVDKLVVKGLVERKRPKDDRRVVQVGFSRRGKNIDRWIARTKLTEGRALLTLLTSAERRLLIAKLAKIAGGTPAIAASEPTSSSEPSRASSSPGR